MNLVQTYSQKQFQCYLDSWNFKCTVYSRSFKTYTMPIYVAGQSVMSMSQ